ncbi:MAG: hypothetical protein MSG64_13700 [Pyrinomonadaceae bacterium MAG19_C2-C3]|nr:hypothetical protein [Pyrinomonadaceae bacterium MAG19_C2-C3]
MSEDPTKRFETESKVTQPMLETILKELREFRLETNARLTVIEKRLESVEERLESVEIDIDKTRAVAHDTRGDVRELRAQLREALPSLVK